MAYSRGLPMKTCMMRDDATNESDAAVPCLISAARVSRRVRALARAVSRATPADRPLVVVGVLHGAYVFMADLIRSLNVPVRCGFVMVSSYGDDVETSGTVDLRLDVTVPIGGEHVLLVDDILDTGVSLAWLLEHLKRKGPASLRVAVLLDKPARRRVPVEVAYVGFEIPDRFVVGYGVDFAGRYRELPYIGYVEHHEPDRI